MKMPRKSTKKPEQTRWQAHVRLDEADFKLLLKAAERESRSITMQIQHYIRMGLRQSGVKQ